MPPPSELYQPAAQYSGVNAHTPGAPPYEPPGKGYLPEWSAYSSPQYSEDPLEAKPLRRLEQLKPTGRHRQEPLAIASVLRPENVTVLNATPSDAYSLPSGLTRCKVIISSPSRYTTQHPDSKHSVEGPWSVIVTVKDNFGHAKMSKCDTCKHQSSRCPFLGQWLLERMISPTEHQRINADASAEADTDPPHEVLRPWPPPRVTGSSFNLHTHQQLPGSTQEAPSHGHHDGSVSPYRHDVWGSHDQLEQPTPNLGLLHRLDHGKAKRPRGWRTRSLIEICYHRLSW